MAEFGFDSLALLVVAFVGLRYALAAIRKDVGRGERLRDARERRLAW